MVDIFDLRKAVVSKLKLASQSFLDYFKPGEPQTKLQRGRDPVLGSFRLQNRTRLILGSGPVNSTGGVGLTGGNALAQIFTAANGFGPGQGIPVPFSFTKLKLPNNAEVVGRSRSIPPSNDSVEANQYNLRGRTSPFPEDNTGKELFPISDDAKNTKTFIKRKLEERSHLMFDFQNKDGPIRAFVPFFENIKINESQQSNLADYSLLARNSQIFAYMGANSRNIKIQFSFKLLHIHELRATEGIDQKFISHYKDFNDVGRTLASFTGGKIANPTPHATINRNYYNNLLGTETYNDPSFDEEINGLRTIGALPLRNDNLINRLNNTINAIIYWINLIRSSTLNNSKNTTYGPPLVRITHGPMYNAVPCIVKDFSIDIDESGGYESETLFPRVINVSLNLMETRIGNFKEYIPFNKVYGDNMAGWEAVFDSNTMDPHNGIIGRGGI